MSEETGEFFENSETQKAEEDNLALSSGEMLISDEVVAITAGVAATEVEGVVGMSSGFAGGIVEAFGRVNLAKGVKVVTEGDKTTVDLYVILKYGFRIPDVAWNIQEKVKNTVEALTGITVETVNIHVQGIDFEEDGGERG